MKRSRNQRFDFFLEVMHSAMQRIIDYTKEINYEQFTSTPLIRDAVIRNFEVMGESVKHVPFSFQRLHGHIPWKHILSLRNFIVHEFFDVDDEILWEIIQNDLKNNMQELESILSAEGQKRK